MRSIIVLVLIACAHATAADPTRPVWRCNHAGHHSADEATLAALLEPTPGTLGRALAYMHVAGDAPQKLLDALDGSSELSAPIPGAPHARLAQIGRDAAGKVTNVSVFVEGPASCAIANVWGAPTIAQASDAIWLDPDTHTRAIVVDGRQTHIVISAYTSVEDVLAPRDPKRLGFEMTPLLGAKASAVRSAFTVSEDEHQMAFALPPLPRSLALGDTVVALDLDAGDRVAAIRIVFDTGDDRATADAIVAMVAKKYGPASASGTYANGHVTVRRQSDMFLEVKVSR